MCQFPSTVVFCKWVLIVFRALYMRMYFSHNDLLVWTSGMFLTLTPLLRGAHSQAFSRVHSCQGKFDQHRASRIQISSKSQLSLVVPRYVTCEWSGTRNYKPSTPVQLCSLILLRCSLPEFGLAFHCVCVRGIPMVCEYHPSLSKANIHDHNFCRRNFMDPQQVWSEKFVAWCWDAVLHHRSCLLHTCHLLGFKCSSSPHEIDWIIHVLDMLHVLSVLLVQGIAWKRHESHLRFLLWVSNPYKTITQIFKSQIPSRNWRDFLETKLIVFVPRWMRMCTWCHQAYCNPWARVTGFSTKQVLAKLIIGLLKLFLNHV